MKKSLFVLLVCLGLIACGEDVEPLKALQKGAPNTITLSTGDVVYDISGEWNAIVDFGGFGGDAKDILKIRQEGHKFVGILSTGNDYLDKGDELLKGELEKNGFKSIERNSPAIYAGWISSTGKIDESCKKITVISGRPGDRYYITLTRK